MKKIVSLLIAMVFSLSISAFAFAEVKSAADTTSTKVEEQKTEPAAKKKVTKKKHTKKKKTTKKTATKKEKTEKSPEQPAEKK